LQLGYNIAIDNNQSFKNSLTLEFKVGFGLNARQLKRNRQKNLESEQQEIK
jgi:hypothetical protein